jgi:hypothetical protein
MNAYQTADADQHWREEQLETQHAVEDYHLEAFFTDPPERCDGRCAWKDPWGHCTKRQSWPCCDLNRFLREERIIDTDA